MQIPTRPTGKGMLEMYKIQIREGDQWRTVQRTDSREDADSWMLVYQRSYSLSDVRILRTSDNVEIARG